MAGVERSLGEKVAELSGKIDKITIAIGAGIYVLASATGIALVIGSTLSLIPTQAFNNLMRERRLKKH